MQNHNVSFLTYFINSTQFPDVTITKLRLKIFFFKSGNPEYSIINYKNHLHDNKTRGNQTTIAKETNPWQT